MKTNKIKCSASEQFMRNIAIALEKHYKEALSERIRTGLRAKKLSTRAKLRCKAV